MLKDELLFPTTKALVLCSWFYLPWLFPLIFPFSMVFLTLPPQTKNIFRSLILKIICLTHAVSSSRFYSIFLILFIFLFPSCFIFMLKVVTAIMREALDIWVLIIEPTICLQPLCFGHMLLWFSAQQMFHWGSKFLPHQPVETLLRVYVSGGLTPHPPPIPPCYWLLYKNPFKDNSEVRFWMRSHSFSKTEIAIHYISKFP